MPTQIEWTDETWNSVTGCTKVSPGCDNCYMYAFYPRLKAMGVPGYEFGPDRIQLLPERLGQPLQWKKQRVVFVNSMSDLFHHSVPYEYITRMFLVMREARQHIFQVLTKRPGRAVGWRNKAGEEFSDIWPPNVWMGASVENQKYAPRLTVLGRIPAPVRFVSAEPLLGPLDLSQWLDDGTLHWVIAGGESGSGARPMHLGWARELRNQAAQARVPFFLKQLGGHHDKRGGQKAVLDGMRWHQMPAGAGK